jgi:general secretion pathway protein F
MRYDFRAIDRSGHQIFDSMEAGNEDEVISTLLLRELTPLTVIPVEFRKPHRVTVRYEKIRQSELAAMVRELATMLESGVSVIDAVETLANQSLHANLSVALKNIYHALQQGQPFSEALEASGLKFPAYVTVLAGAGEATGEMAVCLNNAAEQMEFDLKLRSETREALTYPTILIASGVFAIGFIFAFVVPRFSSMLEGRGVDLPLLSIVVLRTGAYMNENWNLVLGALAVVVCTFWFALRSRTVRDQAREIALRLPVIGKWIVAADTARWTSMLSVLIAGRVPILSAVEMASSSVLLIRTRDMLNAVENDIRNGRALSDAVADRKLLGDTALTMLRVGEKAGAMSKMIAYIAKNSTEHHRAMQRRIVALTEPVSIIVIGISLGTIMVGVILAMTSLTEIKF